MIRRALEARELFTLHGGGVPMCGTYHKPAGSDADGPRLSSEGRIGVLFLNSLSVPRASTGDSAVFWADAFAACGYPTFRVDLPGLGDTYGEIPNELLDYINAGGYASVTATKVSELVQEFQLAGVVVVGHCAGAVTAVYGASPGKDCKGLVLMDPYFHLTQAVRPKMRQGLSDWARRSKIGGWLSNLYDVSREFYRSLQKGRPPKNANAALLARWKQVASTGLPVLILKAPGLKSPGIKPRVGEFDYIEHVLNLAGRKGQVLVELVEGTDHSFADSVGRLAVRDLIRGWLNKTLPQADQTTAFAASSRIRETRKEEVANQSFKNMKLYPPAWGPGK